MKNNNKYNYSYRMLTVHNLTPVKCDGSGRNAFRVRLSHASPRQNTLSITVMK